MTPPSESRASPEPSPVRHRYFAVAVGIFIVLLMVSSGFGLAQLDIGRSAASAPVPPSAGGAWFSPYDLQSGPQLQSDPVQALQGTPLSNLPNASIVGSVPAQKDTWFTIGFPMSNESELTQLINEQGTPGSPLYHQWLTNAQEAAMFGPSRAVFQNTVNYFTSEGFEIGTVGPVSVSFHAPARSVELAFHTNLAEVAYHNATTSNVTVANTVPLALPQPIAGQIAGVDGLSGPGNLQVYHSVNPMFAQAVEALEAQGLAPTAPLAGGSTPSYNATMAELFNYTDEAFTWFSLKYSFHTQALLARYQSVAAPTFNGLYDANPLLAKGYNGNSTKNPITIVIVMAGGINPGDIQSYSQLVYNNPNQIIDRLSPTPVDGAYKMNGTLYYTDGDSGEMALDIEFSSTMAPGAHIIPVYGPSLSGNYLDDVYARIATMSPAPNIISNSWGGTEDGGGTLYAPGIGNFLTMHEDFLLIEAKGSSILASSADGGGFDPGTGILSGAFPATDPYVLSIDGLRSNVQDSHGIVFPYTNLSYGVAQAFIPLLNLFQPGLGVNVNLYITKAAGLHNQSYWYEPLSNTSLYTAPPSGSGGFGFSYWFQQPYWQHAPGVPNIGRSLGSAIAAEADYNMSIFYDGIPNFLYGGTSFACPTTAGMLADIEDYLRSTGHSPYLGNANMAIWSVGNAWMAGDLNLTPYYDVTNGTSFWGNHGAELQYAWPPGQNFPLFPGGTTNYGNTLPAWDFPTGWGSPDVYNFALDLAQLESQQSFDTVNATTNTYDARAWQNMTLNQTYTVDVTTTSAIAANTPVVTVEYFPQGGSEQIWNVSGASLTLVPSPALGLRFTLNTGGNPFNQHFSPGLIVFLLSDASSKRLGFGYTWIGPEIPAGSLNVQVVDASPSGSIVGGCATANLDSPFAQFFLPDQTQSGLVCETLSGVTNSGAGLFENTFEVRVTNAQGQGVYNAVVNAAIGSIHDLAWVGSPAELRASYQGNSVPAYATNIISQTFTNVTGFALIQTWNMAVASTYYVNVTYGPETGKTTYEVVPAPNVSPGGINDGTYQQFNPVELELWLQRGADTNASLNNFVPNFTNQTGLYNSIYAWQGEVMQFRVTNWTGSPMPYQQVWLGRPDTGREYKFTRYSPSGGVEGITNSSGTVGFTNQNGYVTIDIPDNMSAHNFWGNIIPAPMGIGDIAVDFGGVQNRTFQYNEKCAPVNRSNPSPLITCQFNNSYDRNYTATPLWILPNPVNVTTMTPAHVRRDFFAPGTNVSFLVNVSLPTEDPLDMWYFLPNGYNQNPAQWSSGLEHITGITAYVDGHFALNVTPEEPPQIQLYAAYVNLSSGYYPGIHNLTVYVTTSMGQVFSYNHRFIVGEVTNENLNSNHLYTVLPYTLNWSVDIPSSEISNVTFNSSLQITYLSACGTTSNCPVVNYSIRVNQHQTSYSQSLNTTLLGLRGFGFGTQSFPTTAQYEVTIWFSANHSGSFHVGVNTYFVFQPLQGKIVGPDPNASVPLGNVTIAYSYQGGYITNATLSVWQNMSSGPPQLVYTQLAFIPGLGGESRSGSVTWVAVATGRYWIEITLGAPYTNTSYVSGEGITVQNLNPTTTINTTLGLKPLFNVNPAALSAALALIGAVIGLLLGLWVAPAFRPSGAGASPTKAWDEGKGGAAGAGAAASSSSASAAGRNECPVCHERFETSMGLTQHQRVVHGLEE